MIGYDPNGLMFHMDHKQEVYEVLSSCAEGAERESMEAELIEQSKAVIFEKTGVKVGSKAVVCLSNGLSLMGGIKPLHDHNDPEQHITVEVTKIDYWGEIHYLDQDGQDKTTIMGMITVVED